jgi:ribosomal protein S18 acetylase RimI-like enzyme
VSFTIAPVREEDLGDLLPLLRGYCDFYEVSPSDEALLSLCGELLAEPELNGIQLIAREETGPTRPAHGFATIYWTFQTLNAACVGVLNDLFVAPQARGSGLAEALIDACAAECRARRIRTLVWQTAVDNHRAQALYDRIGARRSDRWLDYELDVA